MIGNQKRLVCFFTLVSASLASLLSSPSFKYILYQFIRHNNYLFVYSSMNRKQTQNTYVPSKYTKAFNTYSKNQLKSVIPILRSVVRTCHIAFKYPVYKVLKAIAKIFLMNQVEAIFFAYMIKETNWDIRDKLITQNSQNVRDVVCYLNDQPEYKNLILYLMLVIYSLKFFLNQNNEELLEEATRICPGFKIIFQNWAKKHSNITKKINLKTLNRVYQDLFTSIRHQEPDFNLLVDSTLQISPAYNPQKSQKDGRMADKKEDRKEQPKEVFPREHPTKIVKTENQDINVEHNPIFSSSRLYEMARVGLTISQSSNFQVFNQNNLKNNAGGTRFVNSIFGSSALLDMPNPNYFIKDVEEDCEQLNLGLQQGQSEENINFNEAINDPPIRSVLNLSRGISITEGYFSLKEGSEFQG